MEVEKGQTYGLFGLGLWELRPFVSRLGLPLNFIGTVRTVSNTDIIVTSLCSPANDIVSPDTAGVTERSSILGVSPQRRLIYTT